MKRLLAILAAAALAAGCQMEQKTEAPPTTSATPSAAPAAPAAPAFDPNVHRAELTEWQKNRTTRLTSEDGWTTLVGLHWLQPGANDVKLANGTHVNVELKDGKATLAAKAPMTIDEK